MGWDDSSFGGISNAARAAQRLLSRFLSRQAAGRPPRGWFYYLFDLLSKPVPDLRRAFGYRRCRRFPEAQKRNLGDRAGNRDPRQTSKGVPMKRVFILAILMTTSIVAFAREGTAEGNWLGTLDTSRGKLRMLVSLHTAADGTYIASAMSVDEGGARLAFSNVEVDGGSVRLRIDTPAVRFEGSLSPDGATLKGTW